MHDRRQAGFQLLELLAALLIAAILLEIATMSAGAFRAAAVRREAERLAARLEEFELKAQQREEDLVFEIQEDRYSAARTVVAAPSLLTHLLPRSMRLYRPAQEAQAIALRASGTATPATLHLEGSGTACVIVIALRGRIRVECQ